MSDKLITLDQHRLLAERVNDEFVTVDDEIDLLATVADAIDDRVTAVDDKVDALDIPTKTSELTNDSKFQTDVEVAASIAAAPHLKRVIVDSVDDIDKDADDADQFIYMVKKSDEEVQTPISIYNLNMAPEMHRVIFRGKNLGSVLTDEQKQEIQNGTFKDLWLGDYWTINGVNWRIADFDYWWNTGNPAFLKHHLVIMPDSCLGDAKQMNPTSTTEGGYVGSVMYTTNMNDAKAMCTAAFGSNILSHKEYLVNAVSNGKPSGGSWLDSTIELPNECMIYGHFHFVSGSDGVAIPSLFTVSMNQLTLFAVAPRFAIVRLNYWLRDVVSANDFSVMGDFGASSYAVSASANRKIRPVFAVGVPD